MADTLARIYAQAIAHPRTNAFLNAERVHELESLVANAGPGALQLRYELAYERLAAGQTREAIAELEALLRSTGKSIDAMSLVNKAPVDLLGIAYLRLGEQENCNLNPSARVCILPLAGEARHKKEEGARKAIAVYEGLLRLFPEDRGTQWLLPLAQRLDAALNNFRDPSGEDSIALLRHPPRGTCIDRPHQLATGRSARRLGSGKRRTRLGVRTLCI